MPWPHELSPHRVTCLHDALRLPGPQPALVRQQIFRAFRRALHHKRPTFLARARRGRKPTPPPSVAPPKGLLWDPNAAVRGLCGHLNLESEVMRKASSPRKGKKIPMAFASRPMSSSEASWGRGRHTCAQAEARLPQGLDQPSSESLPHFTLPSGDEWYFGGLSPHLPFKITDHPVAPVSSGASTVPGLEEVLGTSLGTSLEGPSGARSQHGWGTSHTSCGGGPSAS